MATTRPHDVSLSDDAATSSLSASSTASSKRIPISKQRNAFTTLMSRRTSNPPERKRKSPPSTPITDPARATIFLGRDGLGAYISSPESYPASRVIYHTSHYVLIKDLYPKSSIHLLLLPRSPKKALLHPFEAFEDASFLAETKLEIAKAKALVAKELRRRYGHFSAQDRRLLKEEENGGKGGDEVGDTGADDRPGQKNDSSYNDDKNKNQSGPSEGRDWSKEILVGVHAVPSMRHLHIHILSRDRFSECVKHRKHYNSFATPFLVPLEDFPLESDDKRRRPGREGFLREPLRCWRCGRDFGNKFVELKRHLQKEFEVWKRE